MFKNVNVGQRVVFYEPYAHNIKGSARVSTVSKVGRDYIHVGRNLRFNRETGTCAELSLRLFVGTLDEFNSAFEARLQAIKMTEKLRQLASTDLYGDWHRTFVKEMESIYNKYINE